jgi:hypothetical protein
MKTKSQAWLPHGRLESSENYHPIIYRDVLVLSGDVHSAEISHYKCVSKRSNHADGRTSINNDDTTSYHYNSLYEFTSSGLSHTFALNSPLKSPSHKPRMRLGNNVVMLRGLLYDLYQVWFIMKSIALPYYCLYRCLDYNLR